MSRREQVVPRADALVLLGDDRLEAGVRRSQEAAWRSGTGGVPLVLFGDRFALGGQPVEAFVQTLYHATAPVSDGG